MPEPDPTLQATALRYAAGDLTPDEGAAFETRLADDQDARDALSEAVRLSAQAIGQEPPAPDPAFRTATRVRLGLMTYRGHPLAWAGLGALALAACALVGVTLADRADPADAATAAPGASVPLEVAPEPQPVEPVVAPMPRETGVLASAEHPAAPAACGCDPQRSVAEIWADLSTPEHVEKAHDDELRWRQHMRNLAHPPHVSAGAKTDGPHP